MSLSPSTQCGIYRTKEAVRQIQFRHALDPTRVVDTHLDELVNTNCPQAQHIFKWLTSLPSDMTQLIGSEIAPERTAELYQDHLNWASSIFKSHEKELDLHETEYRRLGLLYHETPLYLRDPTTNPANHRADGRAPGDLHMSSATPAILPINPSILQSLHSIFNLDCPRTQHPFFTNWRTLQKVFVGLRTLLNTDYNDYQLHHLMFLLGGIDTQLGQASKLLAKIGVQLEGVAQNLREVVARRKMGESAKLSDAFGVAGIAYRRWVGTFPEVVGGDADIEVAERVLRMCSPELSMDWRANYGSWEKEEDRTVIGLLWEADRGF